MLEIKAMKTDKHRRHMTLASAACLQLHVGNVEELLLHEVDVNAFDKVSRVVGSFLTPCYFTRSAISRLVWGLAVVWPLTLV